MASLRVLHVTPYYREAWAYGGIPRVATALCEALARRGHRITVATTDARDARRRLAAGSPITDGGVEVRVFPNWSNALAYRLQAFLPRGLSIYLRHEASRFDLGHLHGFHSLPVAMAARALRRAGVPYVLHPNGTLPLIERRRALKWIFDRTAGRGALHAAARVLATTKAERRQLVACGVADSLLRVVGNPIDIAELDADRDAAPFLERFGIPPELPIVLYLGKLTPRKHVDVLLRACARPDLPRHQLVVAGNDMGSLSALERLAASLPFAVTPRFTGLLEGPDRLAALRAATLVAYPGRDEVFGLSAVEALACGVPVVVAGDSGCGEVVAEVSGGPIVPAGDAEALAAAIASILKEPAPYRAAAEIAGRRVRDRFGSDAVAGAMESVYLELAGAPRAAAASAA